MSSPEIDPTLGLSEKLNRRVFVGLSAAAATASASAAVRAAQEPLGQTHAPLVSESDPTITVERVQLKVADGTIGAYAAWPVKAGAGTPSVVVIMHVWGVDTSIRDVVRRYAKAGFAGIAPDLYARFGAPSGDGKSDYTVFRPYSQKLDRTQYAATFAPRLRGCRESSREARPVSPAFAWAAASHCSAQSMTATCSSQ